MKKRFASHTPLWPGSGYCSSSGTTTSPQDSIGVESRREKKHVCRLTGSRFETMKAALELIFTLTVRTRKRKKGYCCAYSSPRTGLHVSLRRVVCRTPAAQQRSSAAAHRKKKAARPGAPLVQSYHHVIACVPPKQKLEKRLTARTTRLVYSHSLSLTARPPQDFRLALTQQQAGKGRRPHHPAGGQDACVDKTTRWTQCACTRSIHIWCVRRQSSA